MSKYAIVPVSEITEEMIGLCSQTNQETLRKSLDGTLAILKWAHEKPACLSGYDEISHAEALELMENPAWRPEDPT